MTPTLILWIGGAIVVILLAVGIFFSVLSERSFVEERLDPYVHHEEDKRGKKDYTAPVTEWLNRRVESSSMGERLAKSLARADMKMKPGEFMALIAISSVLTAAVAWLIGGQSIIFSGIGAIVGLFLPGMYVRQQQGRRLIHFNDQLPDMLNLMVNGLRAGYSTLQAMEAVSRELPPPISEEFRRVVQEMQLGVSMERALDNLLRRIPSDDLDLVITALNVQREVGGNLAEILDTITYTIRERVRIKGEIRVMTAQVMYSGRFLSLMPILVILVLYLLNREYMGEFFKPENVPCGYIALGLAGILIISGYFTMSRLSDIEV